MKIKRLRWSVLYDLIQDNGFTNFVELGVAEGKTSRFILDHIDDLEITCIDPYIQYKGYRGSHHGSYGKLLKKYECAKKILFSDDRVTFLKMTSEEAVKTVRAKSKDLVFIDANHYYEWVKKDIDLWWPIVREGGILAGHDYIKTNKWGVIEAVDQFVKKYKLKLNLDSDRVWWIRKPESGGTS